MKMDEREARCPRLHIEEGAERDFYEVIAPCFRKAALLRYSDLSINAWSVEQALA